MAKTEDIYSIDKKKLLANEPVEVNGWINSFREGKKLFFASISNGSSIDSLQLVFSKEKFLEETLKEIKLGASILVTGLLKITPDRPQSFEVEVNKINHLGSVSESFPWQKKSMLLETIREFPQFRAKTNYFLIIFRLRHFISMAIHDFFNKEGFYYVQSPIITANDSEGTGEMFDVSWKDKDFFPRNAKLTVSGQLQIESLAQGLGKVYSFSPCFRAEKSNTIKHLAEFWMIEPEIAFCNLNQLINTAESLLKHVFKYILDNNKRDLEKLENYYFIKNNTKKLLVENLEKIVNNKKNFKVVSYGECVEVLKKNENNFLYKNIFWGMDFQSEHEKYLCEFFGNLPIFVTNYPKEIKAFYMKDNSDNRTVDCFDLLIPEIGELMGGSCREDNYEILKKKSEKINADENLSWYINLRKNGYAPSAGFGLGLERLIMYVSGACNIKDVIAFPRYYGHLKF